MAKVQNGVETLPKFQLSEKGARTLQTTDRQTDRQTADRRICNIMYPNVIKILTVA